MFFSSESVFLRGLRLACLVVLVRVLGKRWIEVLVIPWKHLKFDLQVSLKFMNTMMGNVANAQGRPKILTYYMLWPVLTN